MSDLKQLEAVLLTPEAFSKLADKVLNANLERIIKGGCPPDLLLLVSLENAFILSSLESEIFKHKEVK